MILSGWKEIANYLGCGVRTAQRWQRKGLPVQRPAPGRRAHVAVDSEQLEYWIRDSILRQGGKHNTLATVQHARELRAEAQIARANLHLNMRALMKQMAALRARQRSR